MDMTGEYRIAARRQRVWEALNDPETLRQCIPGCQEIHKLSDTEWTAKVVAKVGPVKATFGGKVILSDLDPPNGYTITGEGTGGAAGFAKGGAKVSLTDAGEAATHLTYIVQAQVGGKLAQIGSRLIDGASRKMADDFFSRFAQFVGDAQATADTAAAAPPPPLAAVADPAPPEAAPPPPEAAATLAPHVAPPPAEAAAPMARRETGARIPPFAWAALVTILVLLILAFFLR